MSNFQARVIEWSVNARRRAAQTVYGARNGRNLRQYPVDTPSAPPAPARVCRLPSWYARPPGVILTPTTLDDILRRGGQFFASSDTPLMQQFREVKAAHPNALVLFRVGDFFELFEADAETAARVLGLTHPPAATWSVRRWPAFRNKPSKPTSGGS